MAEESTTPDLVGRAHGLVASANRKDFDGLMEFFAQDVVWTVDELGSFEGLAAVRGFWEDWVGSYDDFEIELEEILSIGNGVVLAAFGQNARPVGSAGRVRVNYSTVTVWADDVIVRTTSYRDIDKARAAAERLAEERG
jgi:ketosteroid isomerase-like protein